MRAAVGNGSYARTVMKSITLTIENSVADYLARIATHDDVSFEEATTRLFREGLKARARAEGKGAPRRAAH